MRPDKKSAVEIILFDLSKGFGSLPWYHFMRIGAVIFVLEIHFAQVYCKVSGEVDRLLVVKSCDDGMKLVFVSWAFLKGQLCRKEPENKLNVKPSVCSPGNGNELAVCLSWNAAKQVQQGVASSFFSTI